jgi:hypothetical protein
VFREWFEALKHYHRDAVDAGITTLIQQATDTYWPALGALREVIRGRLASAPQLRATCTTCEGNHWVPALPIKANQGIVYETVKRCPDCGIPPPVYEPYAQQTALTATEYQQWRCRHDAPAPEEVA